MITAEESGYEVRVGSFEGPMALLLHLIKENKIDIYDIPIALITQQYLEAISLMQSLNLTVAGDFLVMAATLMQIKSKMLLPSEPDDETDEDGDPRRPLVLRLLEYQQFKEVSQRLEAQESYWRDVFRRERQPVALEPEEVPLTDLTLYHLLEALKAVLARLPDPQVLRVTLDDLSVKDQMQWIMDHMEQVESLLFDQLFDKSEMARAQARLFIVVTLLALLEIVRLGRVRILQTETCGALRLIRAPSRLESSTLEPTVDG